MIDICAISRSPRNPVDNGDGTAILPLTHGRVAIIDAADMGYVSGHAWRASNPAHPPVYAVVNRSRRGNMPAKVLYLHRLLLGVVDSQRIDHADGNSLNNRRSNIRLATAAENGRNRPKFSGRFTSKYKGVYFQNGKWIARIGYAGLTNLGRFSSEIDAAKAYDRAAIERYGEFARLNFPTPIQGLKP